MSTTTRTTNPAGAQRGAFDSEALYTALDRRRRELRISANELLRQAGVRTGATWTRLGRGQEISLETFLRLLAWLDISDVTPFSTLHRQEPSS